MLNEVSAICSILGLIITLATFIYAFFIEKKLKSFEKRVLFNTRIPTLLSNLEQHHSRLSIDLGSRNERSIKETLNLCKTVVEDIKPKLSGELETQCAKINKTLKRQYKSDFQFEETKKINWKFWVRITKLKNLWESYDSLNSLMYRVNNSQKDKKIIS